MKRLSKEDLDKAVVKTQTSNIADKTGIVLGKAKVEFVTTEGLRSPSENKDTVAKCVTDAAGTTNYSIKVNRYTELYHPNNIFYLENSERRAYQEGTDPYRLIPVSKECFDLYSKFLITKNTVFLAAAQKVMSR